MFQALELLGRELAHRLGGCADDERSVGKFLAFGDERTGADQAVAADLRAVEHDSLDADQRAVADRAAMQHHLVPDRDVLADVDREARVRMNDAAVLDVAAASEAHGLVVAAYHGALPDARP